MPVLLITSNFTKIKKKLTQANDKLTSASGYGKKIGTVRDKLISDILKTIRHYWRWQGNSWWPIVFLPNLKKGQVQGCTNLAIDSFEMLSIVLIMFLKLNINCIAKAQHVESIIRVEICTKRCSVLEVQFNLYGTSGNAWLHLGPPCSRNELFKKWKEYVWLRTIHQEK